MSKLAARASEARRTLWATDGAISRIERNSPTEQTNTSRSVAAVAVAVLADPVSSAISPRKSPAPTLATFSTPSSNCRVTWAEPVRMTMNSRATLPSRISTESFGMLRSVVSPSIFCSCALVQSANRSNLLRRSAASRSPKRWAMVDAIIGLLR